MSDVVSGLAPEDEAKLLATVDMVRRTGAASISIRYSDDEEPVVWFVVAEFGMQAHALGATGIGVSAPRYEVDAALNPIRAGLRLLERLVDGGLCKHCGRPTGLEPDSLDTMPLAEHVCWYQYDPELKTFRRGCE